MRARLQGPKPTHSPRGQRELEALFTRTQKFSLSYEVTGV